MKLLLTILMFVTVSCFGKQSYTISKDDFIQQFTNRDKTQSVYCFDQNGNKVWLRYNNNSQLTITLNDDKNKILMLHTVKYENSKILATEFNVWVPSNKTSSFNIEDVKAFTIISKYNENILPYFNLDSSLNVAEQKNDSVYKYYQNRKERAIYLTEKSTNKTIVIVTDACYHIKFNDGNNVIHGVVTAITQDSIIMTNVFGNEINSSTEDEIKIYRYSINDISQLSLLKSGGFTMRVVDIKDYEVAVKPLDKTNTNPPIWYAVHPQTGAVQFYRAWLTDRGFKGITMKGGKAIWYEGEDTK